MKKTYWNIELKGGDHYEGYDLKSTLEDLAFYLNEDDVCGTTYADIESIWYDHPTEIKEVYLSKQALEQAQASLDGACDEAITRVIDDAMYQQELRRDYYANQL